MEHRKIVNGVNQAGKAPEPDDGRSKRSAQKPRKGLVDVLMSILSAFAHIVSPIKEEKQKRRR